MKTARFKTNIKCMGCVTTVTPFLNKAVGVNAWKVDLNDPERVLTVDLESADAVAAVEQALQEAGYKAEALN